MTKLLLSINSNTAKELSKLYNQNKIRRIHKGIYFDNLTEPVEKLVRVHWLQIVAYLIPRGILSFRTAFDLEPIPYQKDRDIVFMTSSYDKTIHLPGLTIKINKGNYQDYDEQVLPNLRRSNVARMLLENLTPVRKADFKGIKTIGVEGVEAYLAKEMRLRKEESINKLRDEAKQIAIDLGFQSEYSKLHKIISTLLSSHSIDNLKTPYAKAIVKKEPYDTNRMFTFEKLSIVLQKCIFKERRYQFSSGSFKNISFYESYFSNYIEGTEFLIDEAEDIVFSGTEIKNRHADSHDVLSLFRLWSCPC